MAGRWLARDLRQIREVTKGNLQMKQTEIVWFFTKQVVVGCAVLDKWMTYVSPNHRGCRVTIHKEWEQTFRPALYSYAWVVLWPSLAQLSAASV